MTSPTTIAEQGLKAFNSSNYLEAITLYSQALELNPEAPDYYLKRSIAYQRSSQYELALLDAEFAVVLANRRGKRELIGSAQLRRGIALHLLGHYGDASFCFNEAGRRCGDKEKNMLGMWRKKLELALEKLEDDDIRREVTIVEVPDVDIPKPAEKAIELEPSKGTGAVPKSSHTAAESAPVTAPMSVPPPPAGVITPASKIRHEWYQTGSHVVLTLYVKGVSKDKASIEIKDKTLSISFPLPSGNDFVFDIDPFFDNVVPSESTSSILSTKVEVKLLKANPGKKWADLEGVNEEVADEKPETKAKSEARAGKPVYPSSSKNGPKDWDKLASELTAKPKKKGKEKEGGAAEEESLGYDSDEGGDPVNYFFKKLYKDADEDTRRAMQKSYIESNGTALSTNWGEVGQGKVETSPPEGMTAKKWGE